MADTRLLRATAAIAVVCLSHRNSEFENLFSLRIAFCCFAFQTKAERTCAESFDNACGRFNLGQCYRLDAFINDKLQLSPQSAVTRALRR